jgi:multiple sugar transport system substrate-binding protein
MRMKMLSITLAAAISLLAACGSGQSGQSGQSGTGGDSGSAAPSTSATAKVDMSFMNEPVTIVFYRPNTATNEEQFMEMAGDAIKAKFPNVTIKFIPYDAKTSGYSTLITSGQDFDLIFYSIGAITDMTTNNLQYDMTPLVKKYNLDLSRLEQTQVDFIKNFSNGGLYALPIFTTAEVLAYSKDIFDKFGVPYPTEGMTWDEVYDLAKRLTRKEGGVQYYGFATSQSQMFQTNQLSLPYLDVKTNKPLIAGDDFRKLFDNFVRFYQIPGGDATKELLSKYKDLWSKDKRLAMYAYFNSALNTDGNVDAVGLPSFREAPGVGSQLYPTYLSISSTSKHKDMAFQILTYMLSEEMQSKFAKDSTGLPVIKSQNALEQFGKDNPNYTGKNIKLFLPKKPAAIPSSNQYSNLVYGELNKAFGIAIRGEKDSVTALREAAEAAQKAIDAAVSK